MRRAQIFDPYHRRIDHIIDERARQGMPTVLVSLHSFTPHLASDPGQKRPWEIGILYNADDRAARIAIPMLEAAGLIVGDQLPYSGQQLNATMNRHAEAHGRNYCAIEVRQDLISTRADQARWASLIADVCGRVALALD